ncbi:MAG: EAL domain-containing protein [Janthinobacterium lividum]
MACLNCEAIPQKLHNTGCLYIWAPLGHTSLKIRKYLDDMHFSYKLNKDCLQVVLALTSEDDFFKNIMAVINVQEAADTKVLYLEDLKEPSFEDFSKVTTLQQLSSFYQSHWLVDILEQDRLKCVFQPIFSKENLKTPWATESLLRGIDENKQEIGAGPLFQAAESSNLMFQLDLKARLKAVETFGSAHLPLNLFINFCPTAIYDPTFCLKSTIAKIKEYNINPSSIVFEVTESQKHTDLDHLMKIMNYYRAAGFKVALDDVGAGYIAD